MLKLGAGHTAEFGMSALDRMQKMGGMPNFFSTSLKWAVSRKGSLGGKSTEKSKK